MHSLAWQACAGVHASMRIIDGVMKVPGNFPGTFPGVLGKSLGFWIAGKVIVM